jgi:hypothetical protein
MAADDFRRGDERADRAIDLLEDFWEVLKPTAEEQLFVLRQFVEGPPPKNDYHDLRRAFRTAFRPSGVYGGSDTPPGAAEGSSGDESEPEPVVDDDHDHGRMCGECALWPRDCLRREAPAFERDAMRCAGFKPDRRRRVSDRRLRVDDRRKAESEIAGPAIGSAHDVPRYADTLPESEPERQWWCGECAIFEECKGQIPACDGGFKPKDES